MKQWWRRLLRRWTPGLLAWLIRLLGASLRLRWHDPDGILLQSGRGPVIFVFWHGQLLLMPYLYARLGSRRGLKVLISRSRDGQFITEVAGRFGIEAVRGSSSRGAVGAVREVLRSLRGAGADLAITPDGPRGPRRQLQPGVTELACRAGVPLVPLSYRLSWKWEAPSWDRMEVPLPFSRCDLMIGPTIMPTASGDVSELAAELAKRLG